MKKTILFIALILFFCNYMFGQNGKETELQRYSRVKFKVETTGSNITGINTKSSQINVAGILKDLNRTNNKDYSSTNISYSVINVGLPTVYDLVSYGTPNNLQINITNKLFNAAIVCSPVEDTYPNFPNRRVKYFKSTSSGTNWTFLCDIPGGSRAGFPSVSLLPNGSLLLSANCSGYSAPESVKWFYDAVSGLGSFTQLDNILPIYLYPKVSATSSVTNTYKFISVVSSNDLDSCFIIKSTNLTPPGVFTPPSYINSKPGECYFIGKGDSGKIGIAYIVNNILQPLETGDVYFMESTNNGGTFNAPIKIFDANISPSGDSLGAFRGISLTYKRNFPCVTFETVKQTTDGHYFPGAPANIRFWTSRLNGSDPNKSIVIADTSTHGFHPYISKGLNNDLFASFCRPSIGISKGGLSIFVAFMVPSDNVGGSIDTSSFMNIYYVYSMNFGANWIKKNASGYNLKLNSNSDYDYTYPCVAPINDSDQLSIIINLISLKDSIPGSYVNHPQNGKSLADYVLIRDIIPWWSWPPYPPPVPLLISPENGTTNIILTPQLFLSSETFINNIQISTVPNFSTIVLDTTCWAPGLNVPQGKLNINTTYYWRARSGMFYDEYLVYSDWSPGWSFTTQTTGINTTNTEIPNEFRLHQNYPNPFNPTTVIKFDIPANVGAQPTNTRLIVYDILGKEIATLVNEKLNAGYYEVPFSVHFGNAISSGIYFYKLEAGNKSDIKRMVIIK